LYFNDSNPYLIAIREYTMRSWSADIIKSLSQRSLSKNEPASRRTDVAFSSPSTLPASIATKSAVLLSSSSRPQSRLESSHKNFKISIFPE
jgi:hypothetical protein